MYYQQQLTTAVSKQNDNLSEIFFTFWLLLNSVLALVITQNRVDRGTLDLSVGDITINSGASWSIINNAISTLVGSLTVQPNAGLYITLTSPLLSLQVTLTSLLSTIQNNGIIAFNSLPSLTSSTYNLVGLSLVNTGEMYFLLLVFYLVLWLLLLHLGQTVD